MSRCTTQGPDRHRQKDFLPFFISRRFPPSLLKRCLHPFSKPPYRLRLHSVHRGSLDPMVVLSCFSRFVAPHQLVHCCCTSKIQKSLFSAGLFSSFFFCFLGHSFVVFTSFPKSPRPSFHAAVRVFYIPAIVPLSPFPSLL